MGFNLQGDQPVAPTITTHPPLYRMRIGSRIVISLQLTWTMAYGKVLRIGGGCRAIPFDSKQSVTWFEKAAAQGLKLVGKSLGAIKKGRDP